MCRIALETNFTKMVYIGFDRPKIKTKAEQPTNHLIDYKEYISLFGFENTGMLEEEIRFL